MKIKEYTLTTLQKERERLRQINEERKSLDHEETAARARICVLEEVRERLEVKDEPKQAAAPDIKHLNDTTSQFMKSVIGTDTNEKMVRIKSVVLQHEQENPLYFNADMVRECLRTVVKIVNE